jgi:hypothetical protein
MTVRRTDSEHLVPAGIVAVVSAAMMRATVTAGETEERHGRHARGSENNAENVEVHLTLDVARLASPAQSRGELSPQIGVQRGAITRTASVPPTYSRCQLAITSLFSPRFHRSPAFSVASDRPVLWQ